jgi:hypothetical protein
MLSMENEVCISAASASKPVETCWRWQMLGVRCRERRAHAGARFVSREEERNVYIRTKSSNDLLRSHEFGQSIEGVAMNVAIERWRRFESRMKQGGFGFGLHYAPAHLRQARTLDAPLGASLDHLLPDDYRTFVAEVGYPVIGFYYYDTTGFSFLPPEVMAAHSVLLPTPSDEWPEPSKDSRVECFFALFAAHDLSDIEGYAFGPSEEDGSIVVWLVERGGPSEEIGPFSEWLAKELDRIEKQMSDEHAGALEKKCDGEKDPHRLIDYSLDKTYDVAPYAAADSALHWIESQNSDPYQYGLVDDEGRWRIPMGDRFKVVRPFRDGVAEVILNDENSTYAGPWKKVREDGSLM